MTDLGELFSLEAERQLEGREPIWGIDLIVPTFLLKPEPVISPAMRLIGREIYQETRKLDERECRAIYNARSEK